MSEEKVLKFPGGMTQEDVQKKAAEGMAKMVEKVETNRVEGQDKLEKQLVRLQGMREAGQPADVLLKETEVALGGALVSIEALNQFCDMIKQDLMGMVENLESQAMGGYSTSLHLEALMHVLLSNKTINNEEMGAAFSVAQSRMQGEIAKQNPS